jgi:hypothetical protein
MEDDQLVGRVLRASTTGYACGTRSNGLETPTFGAFVRTQHEVGIGAETTVIGLIYAINIDDDPLVRQLIMANNLNVAAIRDQRENRMIPVEVSILNIGYVYKGEAYYTLPPRPPMSLDPVYLCDADTILRFTEDADFFRLVFNASDAPMEELIAAALKQAAAARPLPEQHDFLVMAGRRLAQLMSHDLTRLNHVLRLIRP